MNPSLYFKEHPDAKDGVLKAYHAYHAAHLRHPFAHKFSGPDRESCCEWCGRTRELVRWDELPGHCQQRPERPDVEDVIRGEETKAFALFKKAEAVVPKLVARLGMSGGTLAILHHTHGYDPETVAGVVDVPAQAMADYHAAMELEKTRSRAARKKTLIDIKK